MQTVEQQPSVNATVQRVSVVDTDVHPSIPPNTLRERLGDRWRRHLDQFGLRGARPPEMYPRVRNAGFRADSWPETGLPGSDLELLCRQLLDEAQVDIGILNPLDGPGLATQAPEFAAVLTRAVNDWIREEWLDREPRLVSSISVPFEHPELAVKELARCIDDPRFVQVQLPASTEEPLGARKYWKIYEVAAAHDIPVAIHQGGVRHHKGAGQPSFYLEEHVWNANVMQSQVSSFICQGVFETLPTLKVVLQEGGVTWAGPLMWSLDSAWSVLGNELPHLTRPPSEYFREHFWFTTQPIEEPEDPTELLCALEHMEMSDHIMFATDYPHWDFDSPSQALPRALPKELRRKILANNACQLYWPS